MSDSESSSSSWGATSREVCFKLADDHGSTAARTCLEGFGRVETTRHNNRLRFVDTFDRRLEKQGYELTLTGSGRRRGWELVDREGLRRGLETTAPLAFAADLPVGPLRDALAPLLASRRLLVHHEFLVRGERWVVVDARGETLARIFDEEVLDQRGLDGRADKGGHHLGRVLRVERLRGREEGFAAIVITLAATLDGSPVAGGLLTLVADAPATPVRPTLDPTAPLAQTVRQTLAPLCHIFVDNLDGARRNLDAEFLHDLRVTTRRSRALLTEVRKDLADPAAEALRGRLREVAASTNAARDLDVLLADLACEVPADDNSEGLALVRHELVVARRREAKRVARALGHEPMRELVGTWQSWLETAPSSGGPATAKVVARRLRRRSQQLVDGARAADPTTHPEALHELRLVGKKVRYLLEAWGNLVLDDPADVLQVLKSVQDRLGRLNDLAVQRQHLRQLATTLVPASDPGALLALGGWLERLYSREQQARRELVEGRESWLPAIEAVARACRGRR